MSIAFREVSQIQENYKLHEAQKQAEINYGVGVRIVLPLGRRKGAPKGFSGAGTVSLALGVTT